MAPRKTSKGKARKAISRTKKRTGKSVAKAKSLKPAGKPKNTKRTRKLGRATLLALKGAGAGAPFDKVLYDCCSAATLTVIVRDKGDGTPVDLDDTFDTTYHYADLLHFTAEVNGELNRLLEGQHRGPVTLPTAAGTVEKPSDTVGQFISAIYSEALGVKS